MHRTLRPPLVAAMVAPAAILAAASVSPAPDPIVRTVYVIVTDAKGAAITDLTAANFTVKEGGKPRDIVKAEPAKARMRLALMVDERLISDGGVRLGLFEFMKRVVPSAEIALMTVGLRNATVVDYTTDLNAMVAAINGFSRNPGTVSNFNEGLLDVTKALTKQRVERPVIVAVALPGGGEVGSGSVKEVMGQLRQSGAGLFAVTFGSSGGGGEQVLEDGARQSGGHCVNVTVTTATPKALQQIADDLTSQYAISYRLPDGVKPDRRLNVSTDRRGVTLRAPSEIPER